MKIKQNPEKLFVITFILGIGFVQKEMLKINTHTELTMFDCFNFVVITFVLLSWLQLNFESPRYRRRHRRNFKC